MFKKIFEYAGPYKKNMYVATVVVLVSVLMGILPFVLAYQVIAPLVMGESIEASFIILRVVLVLACLVLQALFYGWGLNQFLTKPLTTRCSVCGRHFKNGLKSCPSVSFRIKAPAQSKSCSWMM